MRGWWNSCIRAALYRRDQGDGGVGTAVYVLHYIGGTRVRGWNSCIRAALYKRDQGDGVEQQYTCCIIYLGAG